MWHPRFELAFWGAMLGAGLLNLVSSSSGVGIAVGVALLAIGIACFLWSRRMRRSHPGIFAKRLPTEMLWFVFLAALYIGGSAVWASTTTADAAEGLLAGFGLLFLAANEWTREVPTTVGEEMAPLTPSSPGHRLWLRLALELPAVAGILVLGVLYFAFDVRVALLGLVMATVFLVVFESMLSWAKANKRGVYALDDDDD